MANSYFSSHSPGRPQKDDSLTTGGHCIKKGIKLLGLVVLILLVLGVSIWNQDVLGRLKQGVDENLSFGLYLGLMAFLPIFGFPISVFLILGGVRFGIAMGLLAMGVTFPVHLAVVYFTTHSYFRPRLEALLARYGYSLPKIPSHREVLYTSLFVGVPSLPYAVKNYLLALAGIPWKLYFGLCLPIHWVAGAPFVILGESVVSLNMGVSLALVGAIVLGNLLFRRLGLGAGISSTSDEPKKVKSRPTNLSEEPQDPE